MLKKSRRLTKKAFTQAFRKGSTFIFKDFIVKYSPTNLAFSRFGISVGVKISKKATIRNKIKRQLYQVIGKECILVAPKGDWVIIVRTPYDGSRPDFLRKSFLNTTKELYDKLSH